jgi:hypothetical protein
MRIVRKVMRITWSLTSSLMLMSLWLLVVVVMAMSLPAHGATPADKEKSCQTFVQSFYSWYPKQDINNVAASDRVLRYKKAILSPALYRGLKEDAEAQAKAKGDLVGLDFDPFLNAQDTASRYDVGKVVCKNGTYWANVYGTWNGKKLKKPDVVPELTYQGGRWIFVNFHYPDSNLPVNENLLSVLKVLKDEQQPKHSK